MNNNNVINEVEEKSSLSGFDGEVKIENGALPELSGIDNKISESLNMTDTDIKNEFDNTQETAQKEKPKISENKYTENKIAEKKKTIKILKIYLQKKKNQVKILIKSEKEFNASYLVQVQDES